MDIMQFLLANPLFAEIPPDAVQTIARQMSGIRLDKGEILGIEGEECQSIYWIVSGRLLALKQAISGREQVVSEIGPGEPIYVIPALDGGALPTTTQAATQCELIQFAKDDFGELLRQHPPIAIRLTTLFAARLRRMTLLIEGLSLKTVPERLADLLITRAEGPCQARLTQREMASMLGTVREVVARSLAQFERDGWLRVTRGRIEILDVVALRTLAQKQDAL